MDRKDILGDAKQLTVFSLRRKRLTCRSTLNVLKMLTHSSLSWKNIEQVKTDITSPQNQVGKPAETTLQMIWGARDVLHLNS